MDHFVPPWTCPQWEPSSLSPFRPPRAHGLRDTRAGPRLTTSKGPGDPLAVGPGGPAWSQHRALPSPSVLLPVRGEQPLLVAKHLLVSGHPRTPVSLDCLSVCLSVGAPAPPPCSLSHLPGSSLKTLKWQIHPGWTRPGLCWGNRVRGAPGREGLGQWFPAFLTPRPFHTAPHVVATPSHNSIFVATS